MFPSESRTAAKVFWFVLSTFTWTSVVAFSPPAMVPPRVETLYQEPS